MPPPIKPKVEKKIKAWAVIDSTLLKQDGVVMGKIFNPTLYSFSEAIYLIQENAEQYASRLSKAFKMIVVPCTITYQLPNSKKK